MIKITKVMDIQKDQDCKDETVCRLHTTILRDTNLKRNDWIKIINLDNNISILRRAKGGSPKNSSKEYIELDYDSRLELDIKYYKDQLGFMDVNLKIKKANIFEMFKANWYYPNYPIRIAFRLAILSMLLGIIGVLK